MKYFPHAGLQKCDEERTSAEAEAEAEGSKLPHRKDTDGLHPSVSSSKFSAGRKGFLIADTGRIPPILAERLRERRKVAAREPGGRYGIIMKAASAER